MVVNASVCVHICGVWVRVARGNAYTYSVCGWVPSQQHSNMKREKNFHFIRINIEKEEEEKSDGNCVNIDDSVSNWKVKKRRRGNNIKNTYRFVLLLPNLNGTQLKALHQRLLTKPFFRWFYWVERIRFMFELLADFMLDFVKRKWIKHHTELANFFLFKFQISN